MTTNKLSASRRKWYKRAFAYFLKCFEAEKKGLPRPDKPYSHRKFWTAFMKISNARKI